MEIIKMIVWIIWGLVGILSLGMGVASIWYMKKFYFPMFHSIGNEDEVE